MQKNALSTEVVMPQPNNNPIVVTVNYYYRNPFVLVQVQVLEPMFWAILFIRLDVRFWVKMAL